MNTAKIIRENAKVKYIYDYPENREVSKNLTAEDKVYISSRTGFSLEYIRQWCKGKRRNRRIEALALHISRINKVKKRRLEQLTMEN